MSPELNRDGFDCLIIGAGPAGLSAAEVLLKLGAGVGLVDSSPALGGQYLRRPGPGSAAEKPPNPETGHRQGLELIDRLTASGARLLTGREVVGLDDRHRVILADPDGRLESIRPRSLIIATGARERFIPFPGWTLPGVISCGAAQIMLKSQGILADREMVIAGAGPLPLILARQVSRARGRVKALVDMSPLADQVSGLGVLLRKPAKLYQGLTANLALGLKGAKILRGRVVIRARGGQSLEEVTTARLDERGRPLPGTEKTFETGCLAIGHGLVPNVELLAAAGCDLDYRPGLGGWSPRLDETLQTTVAGIFAAGEAAGLGGADKAFVEGRLAGLGAARYLGLAEEPRIRRLEESLARLRKKELNFAAWINRLCRPPAGLWTSIPEETIICRCEDITMADLKTAAAREHLASNDLKRATRIGMGLCQGRTCTPLAQEIIQALTSRSPASQGPPSVRFPLQPIGLTSLAELADLDRER